QPLSPGPAPPRRRGGSSFWLYRGRTLRAMSCLPSSRHPPKECLGDALVRLLCQALGLEPARGAVVPDLGAAQAGQDQAGAVVADALTVELSPADVARVVGAVPQAVELSQVVEVDPVELSLRPAAAAGLDQPGLQPRLPQSEHHPCAVVTLHRPRQLVRPNHDLPL